MTELSATAFTALVAGRHGHFRLESGHHSRLWLDLDALFAAPRRVAPFVDALASALRPYRASIVCGPLLGGAFLAQSIAHALGTEFCYTERVRAQPESGLFAARYRLPPAFRDRVRGRRVVLVDDVMSAGSSMRATYTELRGHGAEPVAAGSLMMLGSTGAEFFARSGVACEAVIREPFDLWDPAACPLCANGVPIEDVALAAD